MDIAGLLVFAGVYFVAVASPGPGMALVVARSIAKGLHGLPAFVAGFVVGDLILFALAASGLAFAAQTFGGVFAAIKYAGAAYLLYLAVRIWRAPVHDSEGPVTRCAKAAGGRSWRACRSRSATRRRSCSSSRSCRWWST